MKINKRIFSWTLYDWANSAFSTTVMAGFFPVFFKKYWSYGVDASQSTFQLGTANSLSAGVLAFLSPVLGALADQAGSQKRNLIGFTLLGVVMTGALYMVQQGDWQMAILFYVLASIGFSGANIFYDALLVLVAPPKDLDSVSALGYSMGYLGGGILFALNVFMTLKPHLFGLADNIQAVRVSFVTVAIWWAVFSLPLIFFVKEEKRKEKLILSQLITGTWLQLKNTYRDIRSYKNISLFLIAYFFYIDGVGTIVRMAVDYGLSLGFGQTALILALLLTQFVGFPAGFAYIKMSSKVGTKKAIFAGIFIYMMVTVWGFFMTQEWEFYGLAITIGLAQGGVQALSRSVFGAMSPKDKAGEFFGFFNMLGKFSSLKGPLLLGYVSVATGSPRLSILSILLLFIVGGALLAFAKFPEFATQPKEISTTTHD